MNESHLLPTIQEGLFHSLLETGCSGVCIVSLCLTEIPGGHCSRSNCVPPPKDMSNPEDLGI